MQVKLFDKQVYGIYSFLMWQEIQEINFTGITSNPQFERSSYIWEYYQRAEMNNFNSMLQFIALYLKLILHWMIYLKNTYYNHCSERHRLGTIKRT